MKQFIASIALILSFLFVFAIRGYFKITKAETEGIAGFVNYQSEFDKQFDMIKIPNEMEFAGEKVPIGNFEVRRKFAKEYISQSYWLLPSIFRDPEISYRFNKIKSILRAKKIPQDFVYLMLAESSVKNRVSPKGAAGVWQLMPESAKGLGLVVDNNIDERYDYIKATYAACDYLIQAYEEFGSWTLAAASYNAGISGISRKIGGNKEKTYFDLYLNQETSRYVYRILAIKDVMKNPSKYGYLSKQNIAPKTFILEIDSSISNLEEFSNNIGQDIYQLKKYNPWLVSNQLPNSEGKRYYIEFPIVETITISHIENEKAVSDTPMLEKIKLKIFKLL